MVQPGLLQRITVPTVMRRHRPKPTFPVEYTLTGAGNERENTATPQVLQTSGGTAAVWLAGTMLQTLVNAAAPAIGALGATHGISVNKLTVSTSPPNTVTMTADCTLDGVPGTIGITETLGTTNVSWVIGDPAMPQELTCRR